MRTKMGRMLVGDEIPSTPCLVMLKEEDDSRVRPAWIRRAKGNKIAIAVRRSAFKSRTIRGRKNAEGLVIDKKTGKCVFLWEYVNLDGTTFKPLAKDGEV